METQARARIRRCRKIEDADAGAGHRHRAARMRYTSVREHLAEALQTKDLIGNATGPCPICDFYAANLDGDPRDVEEAVYRNPEYGALAVVLGIRTAEKYNNRRTHAHGREIAAAVQNDGAIAAVEYQTWDKLRTPLEEMLRDPLFRFVSWEACFILVGLINEHHPRPRAFLSQPAVRSKLPDGLDLTLIREAN